MSRTSPLSATSTIHSGRRAEFLNNRQARLALADLIDVDIKRVSHVPLLARIWSLRDNLTPYAASQNPRSRRSGI
jgi:hypothetical protein